MSRMTPPDQTIRQPFGDRTSLTYEVMEPAGGDGWPSSAADLPPSLVRAPLKRLEWVLDQSPAKRSPIARGARLTVGALFLAYGLMLLVFGVIHDELVPTPLFMIVGSIPIFLDRFGLFGRYFLPVFLGLFAYGFAASDVQQFKFPVHYMPQIDFDKAIGGGTLPTVWLQQHLYHGTTGPLEAAGVVAYAGHFLIPLAVGTALVLTRRTRAFHLLMFSILVVSIMGVATFVLAPTAPPWLAADNGYLTGVHHVLKQSLYDLDMTSLASMEGNPSKYDITAAAPSLHTAFPLICLLTAYAARLPRPAIALLALDFCLVVFSIVYTGEHYVFDVLAGIAYATVAWLIVRRLLGARGFAGVRS